MPFNPLYNKTDLKDRRQWLRQKATHTEKVLWQDLRNRRTKGANFYRQFSIGSFVFDFYCPAACLAIELDGSNHTSPKVIENDNRKTHFLETHNIHLLRFTDDELLTRYSVVLEKIRAALDWQKSFQK